MNTEILQRLLASIPLVKQFYCYPSLDSTMDQARRLLTEAPGGSHHGTLILADYQDAGRGRNGRTWLASPGQSLLASLILSPAALPDAGKANQSTLLACAIPVAICHGLQKALPGVRIKYPNDIVISGRKLGGILLETCGNALVIGFGINCLQQLSDLPSEVRIPASSMFLETGLYSSREQLAADILTELDRAFQHESLAWATEDMNALCDTVGSVVCADLGNEVVSGYAHQINSDGILLLETNDGVRKIYSSQVVRIWPIDVSMEAPRGA